MDTQNKNRSATAHALRLFIVIVAILMLAQLVTAQESSWSKQNADGTSTKVELLPGGGARATTAAGDDVKDTVTNVPDSKYGQGGSKTTVQGKEGKNDVDIEVYRDAAGNVRELHYTNYGEKDKYGQKHEFNAKYDEKGGLKSYEKKINNKGGGDKAYPPKDGDNEGIADEAAKYKRAAEEVTRARFGTDAPGVGVATNVEQPKMSKTEKSTPETPADNGGAKPSKTPETETPPPPTKTNGDSSMPEPTTSAEVVDAKVPGYSATIRTPPGLFTTVFTTPTKDVIEIYLPRNMVAGETVLGSTKVTPAKPGGLSVPISFQIGPGDYLEVWNKPFSVKLDDQTLTKLRLFDQKKKPVGEVDFHTSQKPTRLSDFSVPANGTQLDSFFLPTSGTFGSLLNIQAKDLIKLDDLLKPTGSVLLGNLPMPTIAATSYGIITRVDYPKPGITEIEIRNGTTDYKRPFRVLTLKLSAGSLNLLKNQSTTVHIIAGGLENLKAPAHMTIAASGVVTMTGATAVEIDPKMVAADGTYTTDRSLYAESAGTFGVDVTVTVGKEPWEQKVTDSKIATNDDGNAGGSTKTSEKKEPTKTVDQKVSVADAEKRIKPYIDYIDKRFVQMTVAYRQADGAKETLEDAFKKNGVGYSMGLADDMAKTGLGQFWSDDGGPTYVRSSEIFQRYLDAIRKEGSTTESYLDSIDQAMEAWKQFDQQFVKRLQKLVDLYTKEALMFDELHAIDVKYTDQLEELLQKKPRPKKEIDELRQKEEAESKGVRDRLETTQKEIEKVKVDTRFLGAQIHFLQPN